MTAPYTQEIAANLARAEESVQAAQVLMAAGYGDFVTSRAYYAAFYAATAALLAEEREFSKHSGVIAAVHQYHVSPDEAAQAIVTATAFLRAIKILLGRDQ